MSTKLNAEPSTTFLSTADVALLVRRLGLSACLAGVVAGMEQVFGRWQAFDKQARTACHGPLGVVELMPTADNLANAGLDIRIADSAAQAVRDADIVTTATADKSRQNVLLPGMIEPGMHLNAIGGDCPGKTELHPAVLAGASVFVEYEPQTRIEGDLQQMPATFEVTEFWRVLQGLHPGRQHPDEVTVFDSVGFALEDFATLAFFGQAAAELGIGRPIELVPRQDDPRDLYGLLRDDSAVRRAPPATPATVRRAA